MLEKINFKVNGTVPLLMSNIEAMDPFSEIAISKKKISKKRNKTEEDLLELMTLEFFGGLYLNKKGKPILPARCFDATLSKGATKMKLGKMFKTAVFTLKDAILDFSGTKDIEKRSKDPNCRLYTSVVVSRSRIMKCRPLFDDWSCNVEIGFDNELVDRANVVEAFSYAGIIAGLGDYRPRYGRFEVEEC